MNSNLVLLFIYELFHNGIKIWLQDKNIKIFIPNGVVFTEEQKNFLKLNKDKICHYLESNKIYSKKHDLVILKSELNDFVLSFAQERLWFIEKYEGGTNAYNIPMVFMLSSDTKLDILEKSIKSIVARHEILRTVIKEDNDGNGYQLVLDDPLVILKIAVNDQKQLDQELSKEINHIYDLSSEYPIKVCFYELANDISKSDKEQYISIVIHHIAFDGWSNIVFFRELQTYYDYHLNQSYGLENILDLPTISVQYKDFALWQRNYLSAEKLSKQLNYWKNKLNHYETLNLITDRPRPTKINYKGQDIRFEIDKTTSTALRALAKELKVSLFSLLLSGYYLMLKSYSNQDDIVVGTPIANRHYSQIENLIGFFVNSVALRTEVDPKFSVKEFIQKVGQEIVEAQLYQDLPFEKLVEELDIVNDTSRHPIFQVVFGIQSFISESFNQLDGHTTTNLTNLLKPYTTSASLYNIAKFDISTFIDDSQPCLSGNFNFAVSLYNEATIHRFIETYTVILQQLAMLAHDSYKQEQTKISDLNYLTSAQNEQIIYNWSQTDKEYQSNKTIKDLFEEQVEKSPDNIAVVYEETKLTYRELNDKANQLANYLREINDIKPDTLIALCLDRSEYVVIAILAVLKAGAAYVPIDPGYPDERIRYILKDTNTRVVLTEKIHQQRLHAIVNIDLTHTREAGQQAEILAINSVNILEQLSLQLLTNPVTITTSTNLAYVIYTSGTTGNPKGVLQSNSNVMRLFTATDEWYQFNSNDIWTLFHSYVFDFSVWEIWGAFIYGGKLVIPTYEQTRDPSMFYILCKQEEVSVLNQTPSAFYQFINVAIEKDIKERLDNLRYVIFGGEALNFSQLKPWVDYYGYKQPNLINMYGITETTVHVTYKLIEEQYLGENSYIGKTLPDLKAYVLDSNLNPLPIGAIGELYIGGAGLAVGYLNQPELTAEKFINNPFQIEEEKKENKNSRLYKTGDLVRWLSDGDLEYIGRNDFQVKIRGHRIELGEIEAALSGYGGVKQSIVIYKDRIDTKTISNDNKYLVAYYVKELNIKKEDTEDFVGTWEEIYQSQYLSLDITNYKQNIEGWGSSYTNEAIDKKDMLEWVNETTNRIKQLDPKVILEIGSGSGLVLFNIIDDCNYYYATDFSKNAIDYINKVIIKLGFNNKISALSCEADKLPYHQLEKQYDTVIMNSIVQYFPNLDYLEKIIINAISYMKTTGKIFIGDIRDYRLLKCFHYSVLNYKNNKVTKAEVDYFVKRDKELLISPEYFIYLKAINKFISHVEIMPKLGKASHEMNNYRYDVILYINKSQEDNNKDYININELEFVKTLDFENYFISNLDRDYLYVKYPNKRIIKDYIEYNELYSNELEIDKDACDNTLNINEILEKVENKNYQVKFLLDIKDPIYLYIIIYKDSNKHNIYLNYFSNAKLSRFDLANNPLVTSKLLANQFAKELKEYLHSRLPEYMVPEYYLPIEKMPLTINGKLDRKALPDPEFTNSDNYVPPRNELENMLCQIWGEVLGLDKDKVGIRDNFFRLGGNSILAIRLASKINHYYQSHLKVSDIFVYKTIESLLLRMLQTKDSYQTIVKLNNVFNKPNMFMIHPGIGGCEVYISLANTLANDFSCYGIDSYNLYNNNQIDNMNELAKYYLSYIDKVMIETNQQVYHLLGWSIGGHIALEIASVLEQSGITKIKIYLLDALIYDDHLFSTMKAGVEETKVQFRNHAVLEGYDELYIEKSLSNIDVETKLVEQKISSTLVHSYVLLFKAMLGEQMYKMGYYHNIDKFIKNKDNIKLIKVTNAHHGNILEQEEFLLSEITKP